MASIVTRQPLICGNSNEVEITLPEMPLDERRAADLEFLAGLQCTPEMIAEQRAALEAGAAGEDDG
ncbi:MAG: hypothetical protein OXE52_15715 [Chloroflexi bacterium]|nr:hypothetical protein [Chloroflexota bacterium]